MKIIHKKQCLSTTQIMYIEIWIVQNCFWILTIYKKKNNKTAHLLYFWQRQKNTDSETFPPIL